MNNHIETSNMKQVIVMRTDLNMRKGKMVAQGAHASMKAILDSGSRITGDDGDNYLLIPTDKIDSWINGTFTKICVGIDSQLELEKLYYRARDLGFHCSLITDNGMTEFNGIPTVTCAAIGPGPVDSINILTGHLKLL